MLIASCALFVVSAWVGAPEICTVWFGICIVIYGISYPPWNDQFNYTRSRRRMVSATASTALLWLIVVLSVMSAVVYNEWLIYTVAALFILLPAAYRAVLELCYQRTGFTYFSFYTVKPQE